MALYSGDPEYSVFFTSEIGDRVGGGMPTATEIETIDRVLSVFETGKLPSPEAYATCTVLDDGAGISYGLHQSTDRSDSLDAIVAEYIKLGGIFCADLRQYLPALERDFSAPDRKNSISESTRTLMYLLRRAALEDPKMRQAQDTAFRRIYWEPVEALGTELGLVHALSYLALYDTCVQSGFGRITTHRNAFAALPPSKGGQEKVWTSAYIHARREWISSFVGRDAAHSALVRKTVYRTKALQQVEDAGNWDLVRPLTVLSTVIS